MEFDDATRLLGQFGRYQCRMFFSLGMSQFQNTFAIMGIVFVAGVPLHWCRTPELDHLNMTEDVIKNLTIPLIEHDGEIVYDSCRRYDYDYRNWTMDDVTMKLTNNRSADPTVACPSGWEYDKSVYTSTVVTKWDLVCGKRWLPSVASSVYMAGFMVGVSITSALSDRFGRRPVYLICLILVQVMCVARLFSPNYVFFCVCRFFIAFGSISVVTTGFVLVMETVGPEWRVHLGVNNSQFWAVFYTILPAFAYFIRDWFTLSVVMTIIGIVVSSPAFFVKESMRWLYANNRREEADAMMRNIARVNKTKLPEDLNIIARPTKKAFIWDLFKTRRMGTMTAIIFYKWFVCSAVYYGLALNVSNLGGSVYLNFFIAGAMEIPCYILTQLALHFLGRRWPLCLSMVFGGVALLCIMAVPRDMNWLVIALAMAGKFGITAVFTAAYVFTAELYPTVIRNTGLGSSSFCARFGAILAPFATQLSVYSRFIPMVIFAVLSISSGLLILLLPETKGRNLPETLEDAERFMKRTKPKKAPKSKELSKMSPESTSLCTTPS